MLCSVPCMPVDGIRSRQHQQHFQSLLFLPLQHHLQSNEAPVVYWHCVSGQSRSTATRRCSC